MLPYQVITIPNVLDICMYLQNQEAESWHYSLFSLKDKICEQFCTSGLNCRNKKKSCKTYASA